jgi:hypothetical protein
MVNNAIRVVKYTQRYLLLPQWNPALPIDVGMPKTPPGALPRLHPTRYVNIVVTEQFIDPISCYKVAGKALV